MLCLGLVKLSPFLPLLIWGLKNDLSLVLGPYMNIKQFQEPGIGPEKSAFCIFGIQMGKGDSVENRGHLFIWESCLGISLSLSFSILGF